MAFISIECHFGVCAYRLESALKIRLLKAMLFDRFDRTSYQPTDSPPGDSFFSLCVCVYMWNLFPP